MTFVCMKVPASDETTLIHGDYRIDNMMFSRDDEAPRALAIIDWSSPRSGTPSAIPPTRAWATT